MHDNNALLNLVLNVSEQSQGARASLLELAKDRNLGHEVRKNLLKTCEILEAQELTIRRLVETTLNYSEAIDSYLESQTVKET